MSNQILELLVGQLWQITILAVVVNWVNKTVFRNSPEWSYMLSLVVMIKSVTPPIWSSHCGVFSWLFQRLSSATVSSGQSVFDGLILQSIVWLAVFVWAAGLFISLSSTLLKWHWIQKRVTESDAGPSESLQSVVTKLACDLGIRRHVRLVISGEPVGPAVIGVWQPMLIIPEALVSQHSTADIEPIIAHELLHIHRGDTAVALLETVARSVWWFHPQIQRVADAMSQAGELCCDEDVLATWSYPPRRYADSLLQVLEVRCRLQPLIGQPGVRQEQVTRLRLQRIMTWSRRRPSAVTRVLMLTLCLLIVLPGRSI